MNCPYQNLMTSAILHFRTRQFGTQAYRDPIDWPQAVSPMNGLPVQSAASQPGFCPSTTQFSSSHRFGDG